MSDIVNILSRLVVDEDESILEPELQLLCDDDRIQKVFVHGYEDDKMSLRFYLRIKTRDRTPTFYWLCTRREPYSPRRFAQYKWMIRYLKEMELIDVERHILYGDGSS